MDHPPPEDFNNEFWKDVPDEVLEASYKDLEAYVYRSSHSLRSAPIALTRECAPCSCVSVWALPFAAPMA